MSTLPRCICTPVARLTGNADRHCPRHTRYPAAAAAEDRALREAATTWAKAAPAQGMPPEARTSLRHFISAALIFGEGDVHMRTLAAFDEWFALQDVGGVIASADWVRAIEHAVSRIEATVIHPGQTPEQLRSAIALRVKGIAAPTYVVPDPNGVPEDDGASAPARCSNCGKPDARITDGDPEGEVYCSPECHEQHDELGCPHEHHDGYRHPVESARLIACEAALRSLASWLGVGGHNAPEVAAKIFEQKIRDGVDMLLASATRGVAIPQTPKEN